MPPSDVAGKHFVSYACEDCGEPCRRYRRRGMARVCIECGIARAASAAREMAAGAGEGYDRWQQSPGPRGRPPKPKG